MEVVQSLDWMVQDGLVAHIDAVADYSPRERQFTITVSALDKLGGTSRHAYEIWRQTGTGNVGRNT